MKIQPSGASDPVAAMVDRFPEVCAAMTPRQRCCAFFAIAGAIVESARADPKAEQRWVDAAEATIGHFGTVLIRANGYATMAQSLDAAIARAINAGGVPERH